MHDITIHHLENSRSHRVLWMLEELGWRYDMQLYRRTPDGRAPDELRAVHPLGRAPVLQVDELTLVESGAVLDHLADQSGQLKPPSGTPEYRLYRQFLHYAEGSVMPPLLVALVLGRIETAKVPFFIKPIAKQIAGKVRSSYAAPEIRNHFAFIEGHLAQHPWFAGPEFTAADIQMSFAVLAGLSRGAQDLPNTQDWVARIQARPAFQRAEERGGPAFTAS